MFECLTKYESNKYASCGPCPVDSPTCNPKVPTCNPKVPTCNPKVP